MRPEGRGIVSAPTIEPMTLAQAKSELRETGDGQNSHIEDVLIPAARRWVEKRTWRALITQTWDFTWRRFPTGRELTLPLPPLQSITSVTYYDTDNASQTLASSAYIVDTTEEPGVVRLLETETWPDTYFARPSAVTVRAVVGFGATAALVPEQYRQAMHVLIRALYDGIDLADVAVTVDALLGVDHARAMIG